MKKFSLLLGALGGAFAGYLFSNKQLRRDLATAKDAESAAKLLGKHLQKDGKNLASQVQDFVESDEVQKNLTKAKKYAEEKFVVARRELMKLVYKAEDAVSDAAGQAGTAAQKTAKRAAKHAKRTFRRVETRVRKLV